VTEVKAAADRLSWAVNEMEERYKLLLAVSARDIGCFNELPASERRARAAKLDGGDGEVARRVEPAMPYLVIVVDEFADLMAMAARQVEVFIRRLAQKSRAVGIHVVLATQRPSVDVITGDIKTNFPCRIAFQVPSGIDSRTILSESGAEKLLGRGDMLFVPPGGRELVRAKGTFVSEDELDGVISFLREHGAARGTGLALPVDGVASGPPGGPPASPEEDQRYRQAVAYVLGTGRASITLLQRKLGVSYVQAGRLIDRMEAEGLVGPASGSAGREVLKTVAQWQGEKETAAGAIGPPAGKESSRRGARTGTNRRRAGGAGREAA
jgi:S-DNA-T family DNA segregation ATPase FtsK/SpoIIIE